MKPRPAELQDWRPSASLETLRQRAGLLRRIRAFFEARGVLEVETPVLSRAATVDPQIDSFVTQDGRWLQTSPEFAMKRLLAAGSGPIWQLARVFRVDERGRHHNAEFTLLEWYRPGWDHQQLIDECDALLQALGAASAACTRLRYREAFRQHAGVDPWQAPLTSLRTALPASVRELAPPAGAEGQQRDFLLDLLMSHVVGPQLGQDAPLVLYDFPASQAALARIRADDPPVAERFEIFWRGIELANGFHELTDAGEQRRRFEADQARRAADGRTVPPYDASLIAALEHGLPNCAGVAIGVDRLLMLLLERSKISEVLAFDEACA
ncbi:MAG: EF-P lysine aminoacylase EpmA [Gammaproteobacteria bacterium]|jgi:lysyl-tRNA synthetase class 2|uniref:EF-P lysine aminoacylase EpmA n=1 Tax=Nevskia sp. TaxID=1929292 RepID=UPI0040357A14|nr:EF-P lysine aminoacylase EpmA [Gammaproteobacteria bacterium]